VWNAAEWPAPSHENPTVSEFLVTGSAPGRAAVASETPARPPIRGDGIDLPTTFKTVDLGLITRRSEVQILPPPLRSLVSRVPRAYADAADQRFRVRAKLGDASFSGRFLGALSTLPWRAYAARRVASGQCAAGSWVANVREMVAYASTVHALCGCHNQSATEWVKARDTLRGASASSADHAIVVIRLRAGPRTD
jgi:hypothetical protein